jgi:hypothetical protein
LHIGTMKSGTSYLQSLFSRNINLLAGHGIRYIPTLRSHRAAAVLAGSPRARPDAKGTWRDLHRDVRRDPGDVLISSELFAALSTRRVQRVAERLAPDELRVIVTARDLTRAAPSHWQETIQNRHAVTWKDWIADVLSGPSDGREPVGFWRQHWLPRILDKWAGAASPGQLCLVTVPQDRSDPDVLTNRFAEACGGLPAGLRRPAYANRSLGATSAELQRRVNERVHGVHYQAYAPGFKQVLGKQVLARRRSLEPRLRLDRPSHERLTELAKQMVEQVAQREVVVSGTLDDLLPVPWIDAPTPDPSLTPDSELLDAALDAIAGMGMWIGAQEDALRDQQGPTFRRGANRSAVLRHLRRLRSLDAGSHPR